MVFSLKVWVFLSQMSVQAPIKMQKSVKKIIGLSPSLAAYTSVEHSESQGKD